MQKTACLETITAPLRRKRCVSARALEPGQEPESENAALRCCFPGTAGPGRHRLTGCGLLSKAPRRLAPECFLSAASLPRSLLTSFLFIRQYVGSKVLQVK